MELRYFYKAAVILLLLFSATTTVNAQNDVLGGWYFVNLNYHINDKVFLFGEVQTRSQQVMDDFFYRELKGGVGYAISPRITTLLGFGNYKTFTHPGNFEKPLIENENRIWEQFVYTNKITRINMEHRVRIEQRWRNGDYFNRFRYRMTLTVPLNHPKMEDKTIFPWVFDEVFFTDKDPYFIRNRFLVGAGYRFSKSVTVQAGFIRQSNFFPDGASESKNFLLTSLQFNAGNNHHKKQPSSAD